ncbi:MAG: PP2C family serine/threonine-protein phosphatase, partial [Roseibium sp.]
GAGIMGATVVVMVIERATAHIIWAGDSRAYLLRDGRLRLLTRDHTVVQGLIDSGVLDGNGSAPHPEAHVVTRAVGGTDELEPELTTVLLTPGDRILLCSDGLTACVADQEICDLMGGGQTPADSCRALIGKALENGAPDNVSAISVFFAES